MNARTQGTYERLFLDTVLESEIGRSQSHDWIVKSQSWEIRTEQIIGKNATEA